LVDEAAIPWLIEMVDDQPEETYGNPQWILEEITFLRDVQGRTKWRKWATDHAGENRIVWVEQASTQLLALATSDLPAAETFLEKAKYRWCDPLMLPTMERLADYTPLRSEIIGWINLTYRYHPHNPQLKDRLRHLALQVQHGGEDELEPWARRLMHEWDFLYEDKTTWEEINNQFVL
jgi:hypothetical protein